jgi:hypothetical protein
MKQKVWITNYRPFIMGGDVHAPIMCEIEVVGEYDLGKGYKGWLFASPSGKTFVSETETGAIVGSTIDEVKQDIVEADEEVMKNQIQEARKLVKRAYMASEEEFWRRLEK